VRGRQKARRGTASENRDELQVAIAPLGRDFLEQPLKYDHFRD
jgi:uncharacterized protein YajQ (UPF0234 family)